MIRVFFDNTEIHGNNILNLTQSVQPYSESFVLGSTICRQFSIDVNDQGYSSVPNFVYLYEDNNSDTQSEWSKYATLLVDNVERQDRHYTTFSLTDVMVRFNTDLNYTQGQTVLQILQNICADKNISLVNDSFYMSDLQITWEDQIHERDLISYVAEVNGGYAYIDADGNLNIAQYENESAGLVDIDMCSSYKIGELHQIDRVYVELGTATQYYPETSQNDTVYLDPDNILLTDTQGYTVENTIRHIYSVINGFTFYNIDIGQCPVVPDARAGQLLGIGGWGRLQTSEGEYITTSDGHRILVTAGLMIPFICTIDWNYNTKWLGGYKLDVDCKIQEETKIITTKEQIRRVSITVDRELGVIDQRVTDLSDDVEASLTLKVDKTDNDQIISMINASADNIILNTKSLIFGVYPNGQYIEVKNYYSGSTPTGVLFTGNGQVRFVSSGEFYINNKNGSYSYNTFDVYGNTARSQSVLTNYNSSGQVANKIDLDTYTTIDRQTVTITNNHRNSSQRGNEIFMSTNSSGETLSLSNYNTSGNLVSSVTLNKDEIYLGKYVPSGSGYTSVAWISINSDGTINIHGTKIYANGNQIG